MEILVDASLCSKGGGVQVALAFINQISADSNFEIICVVSPQLNEQINTNVKKRIKHYYIEKNENIFKKLQQGRRISLIEERHNPDFVFIVFGPGYWRPKAKTLQGFALGKMLYQKELNLSFYEKLLYLFKAFLFKRVDSYLVVETELVKRKLSSYLNYNNDKIFVIGNSYSPKFKDNILKNDFKIKPLEGFFNFLVPGSYYPHKNLEKIVDSLFFLKNKIDSHSIKIKIVFTIPSNSEDWKKLFKRAQDIKVDHLIETVGFIENAKFAELYLKNNAVICASLVESSTAVFPEAFLANRPLLVSDRPFARELCEHAAIYFDPLNEKSIANAMWSIVEDADLQETMVKNGQDILLKNYPTAEKKWFLQKQLIIDLLNK